ncbi:hypothetical protein [Nocardiopsis sp. NRRL B-16309]|uniref:hypothetical protein n=1 Tax=Nocardiopsis sp. NRRL B-16309 TaxID=1519494 RepID=UPI0006AE31D8|nr:hypothetical protein [Nocardiopsis sp. NRRL B-16309]KOX13998.1 hypothetical protein ADL05_17285 [Nocardiopsis sp. NRRL B-16309]
MDVEATQVMTRTGQFTTPVSWETPVRGRLAAAIDRLSGPLAELIERDANDGDTRLLVADFLSVGLNYSKYQELTTEYRTSGDSVDYAIILDGDVFAPVEVKGVGQDLDIRNIQMARRVAAEHGSRWVVLTNGRLWKVFHLRPQEDGGTTQPVPVIDVDLLDRDAHERTVDLLFHLTHEAVEHGRLDALRRWRESTEAAPLAQILRWDTVVSAILAELREVSEHPGHTGDAAEVVRALTEEVIARGLLPADAGDPAGDEGNDEADQA